MPRKSTARCVLSLVAYPSVQTLVVPTSAEITNWIWGWEGIEIWYVYTAGDLHGIERKFEFLHTGGIAAEDAEFVTTLCAGVDPRALHVFELPRGAAPISATAPAQDDRKKQKEAYGGQLKHEHVGHSKRRAQLTEIAALKNLMAAGDAMPSDDSEIVTRYENALKIFVDAYETNSRFVNRRSTY